MLQNTHESVLHLHVDGPQVGPPEAEWAELKFVWGNLESASKI